MSFKNADYLRNLPGIPDANGKLQHSELGARLFEALADLDGKISTLGQQVNGNPKGEPAAPPSVSGVNVTGQDGDLHVAIIDNSPIYRGIRYAVEHADNPHFINPIVVPLHDTRNVTIRVGSQTRYVRAYSYYSSSGPSSPVYYGGAQPTAVNGGGNGPGPRFLPSQGSGTGKPGVGLQGAGVAPFRSANGAPPKR